MMFTPSISRADYYFMEFHEILTHAQTMDTGPFFCAQPPCERNKGSWVEAMISQVVREDQEAME